MKGFNLEAMAHGSQPFVGKSTVDKKMQNKKQISLSLARLYIFAMKHAKNPTHSKVLEEFLKYISEHKNDIL